MPINGSEFLDNPWETIFSEYTEVLGMGFYLVPITFIAVALFIKTKDMVVTSAWLMGSCSILAGANLFIDFPEMALLYLIVAAIGLIGMIIGIFFMRSP